MRFHRIVMGCQMNEADASWLSHALIARGWEETSEEDAQVFIVLTCSVREKPEHKVYSVLGRLAPRLGADGFVAVGGCVAQQLGETLWQRFPGVRLVFGTDGTSMVPDALLRLAQHPGRRLSLLDFAEVYPEREGNLPDAVPAQAYVSIMQGCDNFCAYCIVPYTRGRQKSRRAAAVVAECQDLVARGVREITLLGQNVNSFGQDASGDGTSFAALLRQVAAIPGLMRLRFTTSHPKDIAPEVVAAFADLPNLCPHVHLPVQSGSNAVLAAMGRRYTREKYLETVAALRAARPEIALTTDLIVGFPGESAADFADTVRLVEEVGFASGFSFKYSDRPGTRAEKLPFKVPEEEKARRLALLQETLGQCTARDLAAQVGREVEVLVEGQSRSQDGTVPWWMGRDGGGRIVHFPAARANLAGRLVRVQVQESTKHALRGEMMGEPW
ncbi:tRNA-2-methylthio-N(6)-dimethylallyladenosine synthase [Thermodesulfomicrobium sp. WS]|uniref:tRNA (N6-isopentenyl adenosine(37)-C2)-methylthiotransferase MiaB n=1 Tax=Thermodesulfomicrobium sp. WS TaxID=3004129 RepID=UPI0024936B29|nr:tRNA (N6-isopentenyl adenosine(37)-C2)-methylthiotransferase MiaB [Thermodesulfomicrobium sp. WS]BDV01567.1 tRNA-2-methylthio-N(6)-dimethylallyladenosine synthase [Thermodesulfomicrobium sp. WS]